jgi:uncharacterized protein (TIGR03067 family)
MNARWLLVLALGPLPAAADVTSEMAKAKDLAAFQGEWLVRWVERDGEKIELGADELGAEAVYTIKGDKWLLGDREISSIEIDPGYNPKLLDLTRLIGDEKKGFTMEGIYKIEGDTMVWCCYTGEGAKHRPLEFRAERGWDGTVYHLTRVKRAKD